MISDPHRLTPFAEVVARRQEEQRLTASSESDATVSRARLMFGNGACDRDIAAELGTTIKHVAALRRDWERIAPRKQRKATNADRALAVLGDTVMRCSELRAVLGISEKHVSVLLCQMRSNGLIQRVGIGRYRAVTQ